MPRKNHQQVDTESEEINCETFFFEGTTYTALYGKQSDVPLDVAEELKRIGRISDYEIVK